MDTLLRSGGVDAGETVGDVAYARIRADILFGRLQPGERLRLEAASQIYGASVSTMRELLARLASEGLVVAEGQRGFQVAPASPAEFREVAALRLLLETHAITQSFALGDLDWEARVVAAHHKLAVTEARMLAGTGADAELWKACDRAFHQALISACGSSLLMATHGSVYDKYLRYQMIAVIFRGEVAAREHGALLDCALARDAAAAGAVLRTHIEDCVEHALADDTLAWAASRESRPPGPPGRSRTASDRARALSARPRAGRRPARRDAS